jgi:D-inositol-3-phosphate glycosyltransferase
VEVEAKAIADAIIDFYENKKEAELVEKVKENKKGFSWEVLTQKIYDLM